jgi:hypothetical protein
MKLLLVASDRMEFQGILARAVEARPADLAVDWSRSARLGGNDVLLVANGAGWERAAAAVDAAIAVAKPLADARGSVGSFHPDAIVSLGFCGALDERLGIAGVVVGTSIVGIAGTCATCKNARGTSGPICSIDHVAGTAEEKRRLRASGAIAVEMEAAGVARRAAALGFPLYVVKAVTDLAGETMANDFNAALRSDGHFDTIRVLTGTLRHPTVRIPELIRLRKRCLRAARVLGEFIADCRF